MNYYLNKVFKLGNKKIGLDTLVFNEGTAKDCPSKALGLCDFCNIVTGFRGAAGHKLCYAAKMEWSCKVVNYRERQHDYWFNNDVKTVANDIKYWVDHSKRKGMDVEFFRINEASDFHSLEDIYKWFDVARKVKNVVFYTYTHRSDLIPKIKRKTPKNFVIQTSDFQVDGFNAFISVESYDGLPENALKCKGACSSCRLCKVNHGKPIYILYH